MILIAADHIQLEHRDGSIQRKSRMIDVIAAAKHTLFFTGECAQ